MSTKPRIPEQATARLAVSRRDQEAAGAAEALHRRIEAADPVIRDLGTHDSSCMHGLGHVDGEGEPSIREESIHPGSERR